MTGEDEVQEPTFLDESDFSWVESLVEDDPARQQLELDLAAIAIPGKIRRAICEAATPGEGEWAGAASHRAIDAAVILELRRARLSAATIEQLFATFPIGTGRGLCSDDVAELIQEADDQLAWEARPGQNFELVKVVRIEQLRGPVWWVTLRRGDTGEEGVVRLHMGDLRTERRFVARCQEAMNFTPALRPHCQGRNFRQFAALGVDVAEVEEPSLHDSIVQSVLELMRTHGNLWQDTPSNLLMALASHARAGSPNGTLPLGWPTSPLALTRALDRLRLRLWLHGVEFCRSKLSGGASNNQRTRQITLRQRSGCVSDADR
ncbi:MAG: hypothetical protein HY690_05240 [Chloroflexi bacterium]|nr:hypothetical protein [Chloroflexota bacterium]